MDLLTVTELVTLLRLLVDLTGSIDHISDVVAAHLRKRVVSLPVDA